MIRWIDNLKGFGILLVVIGHTVPREGLGQWIYAFHMPLFFFISGFLLSKKMEKGYVVEMRKDLMALTYRLLFPFYFWNALVWLLTLLYAWFINKDDLIIVWDNLIKLPIGGGCKGLMHDTGLSVFPTWFLPSLFCSSCLSYFIIKFTPPHSMRRLLFLVLASIIGVGIFLLQIKLPFKCNISMGCFIFLVLGFYSYKLKTTFKNTISGIILVIAGSLLNIINIKTGIHSVELVNMVIGNPMLFYLSAGSFCFGFYILFETLLRESSLMEYLGRNSMTIMIFHYPIIYFVKNYIILDIISQLALTILLVCVCCIIVNKIMPWSVNFKLLLK